TGNGTGGGTGGGAGSGGSGGGGVTGATKSGALTADETWTGAINVTGDVTVNTGVTLTISEGALVQVAASKAILVNGTIKVVGTAANYVSFKPVQMGTNWNGIEVNSGGNATVSYADFASPATALSCASGAASCVGDANQYGTSGANVNAMADLSQNYWGGATSPVIGGNTTDQKNAQGIPANAFFTTAVAGTGPRP